MTAHFGGYYGVVPFGKKTCGSFPFIVWHHMSTGFLVLWTSLIRRSGTLIALLIRASGKKMYRYEGDIYIIGSTN